MISRTHGDAKSVIWVYYQRMHFYICFYESAR